ncbi:aminotransferase class III-fold pyridoxal phosphate-dependent enzyme [Nocardia ninae]
MTALRPVYAPIVDAEGGYFTLRDGRRFMDLASQTLNLAFGQRAAAVTDAVIGQARCVQFASSRFSTVPFLELSAELARLAPAGLDAVSLKMSDGSDAVETAMKIAMLHTRRPHIGCLPGAWHGETHLTLGLASSHRGRILADDRVAVHADEPTIAALTQLVAARRDLAAVIIDPLMVAQGLPVEDMREQLQRLRERCDGAGTLLIFDEIQAFGWSVGGLFTTDVHGVSPDIVCLGKALGAGMPLAAVVARDELSAVLGYNDAEFTGGGGPLACAAGLAGLEALIGIQDELPVRAEQFGAALCEVFDRSKFDVRRVGLVATIAPIQGRLRETWANQVVEGAAAAGLFVRLTDQNRRLLVKPPHVLAMEELRAGLTRLGRIADEAASRVLWRLPGSLADETTVVRKPLRSNRHAGYVTALLDVAAGDLGMKVRGPGAQQKLTRDLAGIGVPVAPMYAVPGADAVDYGFVPGRTLQWVLSAPETPDSWVNGLALRHLEVVVRAHDNGMVIGDRWPGNAIVNNRAELTLIDFELGYDGPIHVAALFEEAFCILQTLVAIPADRRIRDDLSARMLDQLVARHGSQQAAAMLRGLVRFYGDPARPVHSHSDPASHYTGLLLAALSRVTGDQHQDNTPN